MTHTLSNTLPPPPKNGCDTPVQTFHGPIFCGSCKQCSARKRRHWLGRIAAESHTADWLRFVTLTYNVDHVAEGYELPKQHPRRWLEYLRRKQDLPVRAFIVGEYGDKTARPHWHALLFGYGSPPDIPLGVSSTFQGWTRGNSQWEKPRAVASAAKYCYDYLDKGGVRLQPSQGMGKQYLHNYALMMARNRRYLASHLGVRYTVPGVNRPDGKPWLYSLAPSHRYALMMVEAYIEEWRAVHGVDPDFDQFGRFNYDA